MRMDDDGEGNLAGAARRTAGGFFTPNRILLIFLFVFGFLAGLFIEHTFVEPLLNTQLTGGLNDCVTKGRLLDAEIQQCYKDLNDANRSSGV
ncbi:MAG: hypothetical protein Q7R47_06750 [Candidatus Diapherotrites archaeon]|nr:hypothetical protein [Candidatus Diapherotrites archaeon]